MSLHLEDRLNDYLDALVTTGRCLSKNSFIRGLVAAAYAWGDDTDFGKLVADGIRAYETRYGARI